LTTSWARFKGLEADAIVIVEMMAQDSAQERANRYVAESRAKQLLTVVQVGR
jgi:DNA helicase IV